MANESSGYKPLYIALSEELERYIDDNLNPGDQLPTELELAERYHRSRNTIRLALERLENRRIINKTQGKGTFVSHRREFSDLSLQALGFSEHARKCGHTPSSKVLKQEFCIPSQKVEKILGLKPQAEVFHLYRIRMADDEVSCLEDTFVRIPDRDIFDEDWTTSSLYTTLDKKYSMKIHYTQERISAINVAEKEAKLLEISVGVAALSLDTIGFNYSGQPVLYSHTIRRSDTVEYVITVNRDK